MVWNPPIPTDEFYFPIMIEPDQFTDNLPPPLMTSDPGSFARSTITERKPQIIQQVIVDNDFPVTILQAIEKFSDEIANRPIQPLHEQAEDTAFWNTELSAYQGHTWLEVPWYFAETYFYRRLLEAIGYYQPGPWHKHDPFLKQKQGSIQAGIRWFESEWDNFIDIDPGIVFEALLHSCLWGNRADLSNYTVKEQVYGGSAATDERHLILIDHTEQVRAFLSMGVRRVDFINDNTGKELLFDLALVDYMIDQGWVEQVVFRLKDRPFFVSDGMPADIKSTVSQLCNSQSKATHQLGERLDRYLADGRFLLTDDPFWTSCLMFRRMPQSLQEQLSGADIAILKGDVNYRRILDDRHWLFTTPIESVTGYFPTSFVALRTLKGEIMVGLGPMQAETLSREDPTWLINGKRGIIQMVKKGTCTG